MAENPLLPHAELKVLYRSLDQMAAALSAERGAAGRQLAGREAVLASTLVQLRQGDCVLARPPHAAAANAFLPVLTRLRRGQAGPLVQSLPEPFAPVLMAVGQAAALRQMGQGGAVLVFADSVASSPSEPKWIEALTWAQAESLPVVLALSDPSGSEVFRETPDFSPAGQGIAWAAMRKLTEQTQLPVLSVDGDDAVALYRVIQESLLRARSGGGPAVLWAALPSPGPLRGRRSPKKGTPLDRLRQYLTLRGVTIP